MKILNIPPYYLTRDLASKICKNKYLLQKYIKKYDLWGGVKRAHEDSESESES